MRIPSLLFAFLSTSFAISQAQTERPESEASKNIAAIFSESEKRYRDGLLLSREKARAKLAEKYVTAVRGELKRVAAAADLDAALEVREELRRVEGGDPIENGKGGKLSKIPELRKIYSEQLEALRSENLDSEKAFLKAVDGQLAALAMSYIKANDENSANEVVAAQREFKDYGLAYFSNRERPPVAGGHLRAFSEVMETYPAVDISKAKDYDDFIKVVLMGQANWAALRMNGTVVSTDKNFDGKTNVADITRAAVLYKDGRIESFTGPGAGTRDGGARIFASLRNNIAIMKDGKVEAWGGAYKQGGSALPPKGLNDIVAIAADFAHHAFAVRSDGTVISWGPKDGKKFLPENVPDLVELSAGWGHFAGRTKDGRVLAWPPGPSWTRVPENLPQIIKIRARCRITAAQKEDLSWIAWGESKMGVRDKINEIGPAIDIAYESNGRGWGYLLWIEPEK